MYRLCSSSRYLASKTSQLVVRQARAASGQAGGGGGGLARFAGGSLLITGMGVGGTIAYAGLDPQFRLLVEDTVPGSDVVMEMVLGKITPAETAVTEVSNKLKISFPVVTNPVLEEKKEEKSVIVPSPPLAQILPAAPQPPPLEVSPPTPNIEEPVVLEVPPKVEESAAVEEVSTAPAKVGITDPSDNFVLSAVESVLSTNTEDSTVETVTNKVADTDVEHAIKVPELEDNQENTNIKVVEDTAEIVDEGAGKNSPTGDSSILDLPLSVTPDIENTSLETVLFELCKDMKVMVESAVTGYQVATETVTNHMNIMQDVLETNITSKDEAAWNKMFEAAVAKSDATKCAEIKEKEAVAAIDNVIEIIAAGRKNKATANNFELLVAEESANRAIGLLELAKAQGAAIKSEVKVMEEYRDLVEAGRQQFHKEMASIMPDVKLGEKNGKLSEDELNMFITHAYKKVLHLQQELARQQTLEQERFKKALDKQRVEIQLGESDKMELEIARQAKELVMDHEKRMKIVKEEVERDIRAQLTRQAAAHSDHLQDMLSVQEAELIRRHDHVMSEELANTKSSHLESLSSLSGMVSGLSTSLQARVDRDRKAVTAQQFWLACSGLDAALDTLKPLMGDVVMVKTVATPGDDFVQVVLASLSPLALDRGVYSVSSLKERFCVVEKIARRVAGIGEGGGSLLSYGLSYLQSVLVLDLSLRSPVEPEEKVDLSKVSQSDLLSLAKHSLDRNNLARAVQYMTLLKGESSRVVQDWLTEARLTMETRQAAEALLAHALVEGVDSLV